MKLCPCTKLVIMSYMTRSRKREKGPSCAKMHYYYLCIAHFIASEMVPKSLGSELPLWSYGYPSQQPQNGGFEKTRFEILRSIFCSIFRILHKIRVRLIVVIIRH